MKKSSVPKATDQCARWRRAQSLFVCGLFLVASTATPLSVFAQGNPPSPAGFRGDRILVKSKLGVDLSALHAALETDVMRSFPAIGNLQVLQLPSGAPVANVIAAYRQNGLVAYAEPDYVVQALTTPNDLPYWDGSLWGLDNTGPRFDARDASSAKLAALTNLTSVELTNRLNAEWLKPPTNLFTLGPVDRLEIEILGGETNRIATIVGPDGRIYYHLLAGLDVWGLTLAEAKALIERELLKYLRDMPQVGMTLRGVQSQRVWLLGRLTTPGIYPLTGPMTLLESLSVAGGPMRPTTLASLGGGSGTSAFAEEVADLRRSFVIRDGQPLPVDFHRLLKEGDMSQNIYLRPDDFVYVPSATAKEVFVLGAVLQPLYVVFHLPCLVSAKREDGAALPRPGERSGAGVIVQP